MSFLTNVGDLIGGFLRRNVAEYPANQVVEVKPEDYLVHFVHGREDSLLLYGAPNEPILYEVVLLKEHQSRGGNIAYSICRRKTLREAEEMYLLLSDKIPIIARLQPASVDRNLLQDIFDYMREHRGQSLAHLATHFGYTEILKASLIAPVFSHINTPNQSQADNIPTPQVSSIDGTLSPLGNTPLSVNVQCPTTGVTPLHIAVRNGRIPVIQLLITYKPSLEIRDKDGNSVLHAAANTTKEVIDLLCSNPALYEGTQLKILVNMSNKDGYSPLHLACLYDKPDCVKVLLKYGADVNGATIVADIPVRDQSGVFEYKAEVIDQLETRDMKNGGTPLHWARSCQVMDTLIAMGCNINGRNFQGETVLHVMVQRNKLPLIVHLLSHGADVDSKGPNGNTALHVSVKGGDTTVVQALVVFGANLDIKNNAGETARHIAATAKRDAKQDTILYILNSCGAKRCKPARGTCNDGCASSTSSNFNGVPPDSSPFHRATGLYDEIFGGSIVAAALAKKSSKWTPSRTSSISPQSNSPETQSMETDSPPSVSASSSELESDPSSTKKALIAPGDQIKIINKKRGRVLCLDGGGIRGLVLVQMLWVIEQLTKRPITDYFDFIAGTSTGGILSLALSVGNSTAECRRMYFRFKDKVFVGSRPYLSEPLEQFLVDTFGQDTKMADIKWPRVMITATVADRFPADLHLFRNYTSPECILQDKLDKLEVRRNLFNEPFPPPEEQPIWATARATGAAPTFFRPQGRFIDGGLISNNPTLDALVEIQQLNECLEHMGKEEEKINLEVVVSLGTGGIPVHHVPILDVLRPDSFFGVARMAFMASALGQLLVEQASQSDGQVVERARSWCNAIRVPYFRLNPPISENVPLDETNNVRLVNMLWETTAYMHSRRSEVEELLTLLLK